MYLHVIVHVSKCMSVYFGGTSLNMDIDLDMNSETNSISSMMDGPSLIAEENLYHFIPPHDDVEIHSNTLSRELSKPDDFVQD